MAATMAIRTDPELRAFYDRLKGKGKHHNAAITAVAHKLARRYWAVMTEQRPYVKPQPTPQMPPKAETGPSPDVHNSGDNSGNNPTETA